MKFLLILALLAASLEAIQLNCDIRVRKLVRNSHARKSRQKFKKVITGNTESKIKKRNSTTQRMKKSLAEIEGVLFKDEKGIYTDFVKRLEIAKMDRRHLKFKGINRIFSQMFAQRTLEREQEELRRKGRENKKKSKEYKTLEEIEMDLEQEALEEAKQEAEAQKKAEIIAQGGAAAETIVEEPEEAGESDKLDERSSKAAPNDTDQPDDGEGDGDKKDDDGDSEKKEKQQSDDDDNDNDQGENALRGRILSVIDVGQTTSSRMRRRSSPKTLKTVRGSGPSAAKKERRLTMIDEILSGQQLNTQLYGKTLHIKQFEVRFRCSYDSLEEVHEWETKVADFRSESVMLCAAKKSPHLHVVFSDSIGSDQIKYPLDMDSNPFKQEKMKFRVIISEPKIFPKIYVNEDSCNIHILSGVGLARAVMAILAILLWVGLGKN